jgi:hypothetical protein
MFSRRADGLLKTHAGPIGGHLHTLLTDPDFERLRCMIALRLAGLFYYVGLMFRGMRWTETGKLPRVYVGGNGCRVFHWIAPPEYSDSDANPFHRLFAKCLLAGAGLEEDGAGLKIVISRDPKSETACGLLYAREQNLDGIRDGESYLISGESFRTKSNAHTEVSTLSAETLSKDEGVTVERLEQLRRFAGIYHAFATRPGASALPLVDPERALAQAEAYVADWCMDQGRKEAKDIVTEPLFILGLLEFVRWCSLKEQSVGHGA